MATKEALLGIRERFITIEEDNYGTEPSFTNAFVTGNNIIITPEINQNFQEILNNGQDVRTINSKIKGALSVGYGIEYIPTNFRMLKYIFDIDSETGTGGVYTHNLSVGNTLKSFSAEWAMQHSTNPLILKFLGNVIKTFTINFQSSTGEGTEGFIKCNSSVLSQDYINESTVETGTFTATGDPFQFRHLKATLNSTETVEVNSGQLQFNQNINDNDSRYANSTLDRKIGEPIPTIFRITGSLNLNLFNTTYLDLWKTAEALSGTNTLVLEQTAGNKITFTLTNVYVAPIPLAGTDINSINKADFVFSATGVSVVAIDNIENW